MSSRSFRTRLSLVGVALTLASVTACSGLPGDDPENSPQAAPAQASKDSEAKIVSSIRPGAKRVDLERQLRLRVEAGTFEAVQVTGPRGGVVAGSAVPRQDPLGLQDPAAGSLALPRHQQCGGRRRAEEHLRVSASGRVP